jgi:ORF6N domain-containing protein
MIQPFNTNEPIAMNAAPAQSCGRDVEQVPLEHVARAIVVLRGRKVLLDAELAVLYGVATKRLNQQVRRNQERFPPDFMFQLTEDEHQALRLHFATSKAVTRQGGRRYLPYVFTEHGATMAATVLNSPRAIEMSVYVVRAFVRLRELASSNRVLSRKLDELERRLTQRLDDHDDAIRAILSAVRELESTAHHAGDRSHCRPRRFLAGVSDPERGGECDD